MATPKGTGIILTDVLPAGQVGGPNQINVGMFGVLLVEGRILLESGEWLVVHEGESSIWKSEPTDNECLGCGMAHHNCLCSHDD